MLGWLGGDRLIEVTASAEVAVPSRLPRRPVPAVEITPPRFSAVSGIDLAAPSTAAVAAKAGAIQRFGDRPGEADSQQRPAPTAGVGPFRGCYTDLIDVETPYDLARELVEQAMHESGGQRRGRSRRSPESHLLAAIGREIEVAGPILSVPRQRRRVALVGPTGVGKTTTLAKLAAHFRLDEHRRVGLISVDTFRMAAVEQLRTYAEIIDLPMEVVSTPDEMQAGPRPSGRSRPDSDRHRRLQPARRGANSGIAIAPVRSPAG